MLQRSEHFAGSYCSPLGLSPDLGFPGLVCSIKFLGKRPMPFTCAAKGSGEEDELVFGLGLDPLHLPSLQDGSHQHPDSDQVPQQDPWRG